jgi:hypothetical protein
MGMARRDIFVYEDGPTWRVEARKRGSEGTSRWWDTPDEDSAVQLAHDLMQGNDQWSDLSSLIGAISPIRRHDPPAVAGE